jgi:hypothetical protein
MFFEEPASDLLGRHDEAGDGHQQERHGQTQAHQRHGRASGLSGVGIVKMAIGLSGLGRRTIERMRPAVS